MPITSQLILYKSYRAREYRNGAPHHGNDPTYLTVKVYNTKRPKAEIILGTGWFSDMRGYGGISNRKKSFTDAETVSLIRSALDSQAALAGLVDYFVERPDVKLGYGTLGDALARWWLLGQQENATAFIDQENRDRAFARKPFKVGDRVVYVGRNGISDPRGPFEILSERFDWHPYLGGGWRASVPGIDAPMSSYRAVVQPASAEAAG